LGSYWIITPEDKDLNFAVENQEENSLHHKVNKKGMM
jgi:hypothetical protein